MSLTSPETLVFWMTLFFLIFAYLLTKMGWKPILNAVKEREKSIEQAVLEAEKVREEMAKLKADNEKLLKQAREERENILKEARELKNKILAEAKTEAEKMRNEELAKTKKLIAAEREAAVKDIQNQVAEISLEIAEKVIGEQFSDKAKQIAYIKKNLSELKLN